MKPSGGNGARLAMVLLLVCGSALAQSSSGGGAPTPAPATSPEAAAAADTAGRPAQSEDEQKIKLPNVNVQGKRNVFNDNDKKLRDMQESLPCTGCDAKPHTKRKFVKRVLDAVGDRVLPTEAPDHTDRDANDRAKEFSQENTCTAANIGGCVQDNLKP